MRRILALAVALVIGLPLVAPLLSFDLALAVPACCRRNGQHHCMSGMMQPMAPNQGPAIVAAKCPSFPAPSIMPQPLVFVAREAKNKGVDLFVRPAALPQTEARFRIAFARSRQKRGPPTILS